MNHPTPSPSPLHDEVDDGGGVDDEDEAHEMA